MINVRFEFMNLLQLKAFNYNLLVVLIAALALTSCSTLPKSRTAMMNAVDTTMGTYSKNQARQLILLTMENELHQQLSNGQPINQDDGLAQQYTDFLKSLAQQYDLERVADWPLSSLGIRCFVFESTSELTPQLLEDIENQPAVETVQFLQIFNTLTSSYNDPLIELQKSFTTMSIEASHQWTTGKGVKVAVIDTGVDNNHRDLKKRIQFTRNFVDKNTVAFQRDVHGTAIAGIIASNANNNEGLVGIAPDVDLYALKSCWYEDDGSNQAYCNSFTLAKALNVAILKDVDLINLSLAGPNDALLQRLVEKALEKNIIVTGAVHPQLSTSFPTSVDGVIAVSEKNNVRGASNQLYAKGDNIISTRPDNKYDFFSGSSISTAQITGVLALIRQRQPHLPLAEIRNLLFEHQANYQSINVCQIISSLVGANGCN